jgi:hypothetical protein
VNFNVFLSLHLGRCYLVLVLLLSLNEFALIIDPQDQSQIPGGEKAGKDYRKIDRLNR